MRYKHGLSAAEQKPRIIGLCGRKQSGKDTFFTALSKYANMRVEQLSLADSLKNACMAVFGGRAENYFGSDDDKNEATPFWEERLGEPYSTYRRIMQTVGTEVWRDNVSSNIWTWSAENHICNRMLLLYQGRVADLLVCTDVRFDNEAEFIHRHGEALIHIVNLNQGSIEDMHSSEQPVSSKYITGTRVSASVAEVQAHAEEFALTLEKS